MSNCSEPLALLDAGAFSCVSKYLTAQSIVNPQTYCTTATIVLSPLSNWLLIYRFGYTDNHISPCPSCMCRWACLAVHLACSTQLLALLAWADRVC